MGKEKYQKEIEALFEKSPVVGFDSIERIIQSKKNVGQYAKQLIRNMLKKGKIKRLAKGYYTSRDESSLAVFCFKPAYLGLQDALSFHELWEQETIPIIITSRKIRQGIRKILGMNVLIRRIDKKYLFGFEYEKQGNFFLPYSDIEKTFIDMVYFNEKISEEAKENIIKIINKKKLNLYLKGYAKKFRKRVLSYL
jgi:predicted transcriptional regulator of viral defense system